MTILMMYGNVGYGKNVFWVNYAKLREKLNKIHRKTKYLTRANFHIKGLESASYMTVDEFLEQERKPDINVLDLIDEPYAWGLESRRSGTDIAIEMTKKSTQSRKVGLDISGLTQLPTQADRRLRFIARSIFLALPPDDYGFHYLYMGKRYQTLHIPYDIARRDAFPHYDTNEVIEPQFSEDYLRRMNEEEIEEAEKKGFTPKSPDRLKDIMGKSMTTRDGIILYQALTTAQVWEEELAKGGKIQ